MNQLVQEGTVEARARINVSASVEVKAAIDAAAEVLGLSAGQVALQAIIAGMPALEAQVAAARRLRDIGQHHIHKGPPGKPPQVRK